MITAGYAILCLYGMDLVSESENIQICNRIRLSGGALIGDYVSVAPGTVLLSAVYSHKEELSLDFPYQTGGIGRFLW